MSDQRRERLGYLDSEEFRRKAVTKLADGTERALLDLHGLTCYACVWLVERAAEGIDCRTRVNLSLGRAEIFYDPRKNPLSRVAGLIEDLGYRVTADTAADLRDHADTLRLGVAWFCFLNVMAIAFADYVDVGDQIDANLAQFFRWISLALTLPAVFYSARTFYEKAWASLKQKRIAIDQSIAVSIFLVFGYSLTTTVMGHGAVYFDSVCGGIALLLSARIFQQKILRRTQREIKSILEPAEKFVRQRVGSDERTVALTALEVGDQFRVLPGEWIPVGAEVVTGEGEVNLEPLTGEARWVAVRPGSTIQPGAFNGTTPLLLKAFEAGRDSYWQDLSASVDCLLESKGRMKDFSDRAAVIFLFLVNGLALALFAYFAWRGDFAEGARRAFALALIACPCAFGLTAPLVFSACAARALRQGVLFKSQRAVEELARAKRIVFDKTGTLTEGDLKVRAVFWNKDCLDAAGLTLEEASAILREVTVGSHHAAAQAVGTALGEDGREPLKLVLRRLKEVFGAGMELETERGVFRLGHAEFALGARSAVSGGATSVHFSCDHMELARFEIEDQLHAEALDVINALRERGCRIEILSGDRHDRTASVARMLNIAEDAQGEARPEDKAAKIRVAARQGAVVMVGNGSNDSLAMAEADVSIAVSHSTSASRRAADVCLTRPGLSPCLFAFLMADSSQRAFRRSIAFAFAYNITGIILAVSGWVTPGVAAALMPISSLCIVFLATRWKEPNVLGRLA